MTPSIRPLLISASLLLISVAARAADPLLRRDDPGELPVGVSSAEQGGGRFVQVRLWLGAWRERSRAARTTRSSEGTSSEATVSPRATSAFCQGLLEVVEASPTFVTITGEEQVFATEFTVSMSTAFAQH